MYILYKTNKTNYAAKYLRSLTLSSSTFLVLAKVTATKVIKNTKSYIKISET